MVTIGSEETNRSTGRSRGGDEIAFARCSGARGLLRRRPLRGCTRAAPGSVPIRDTKRAFQPRLIVPLFKIIIKEKKMPSVTYLEPRGAP
jgi:hypothetical protein